MFGGVREEEYAPRPLTFLQPFEFVALGDAVHVVATPPRVPEHAHNVGMA
jgi:hypothetical protein